MHGHVRAGFSAFCLLLALPLTLPLLLPLAAQGKAVWELGVTAASVVPYGPVWGLLILSDVLLLGMTSLTRRQQVRI